MDFKWIKTPTSEKEEKEQFNKLYQLLSQLSEKGKEQQKEDTENKIIQSSRSSSRSSSHIKKEDGKSEKLGDMDEFMQLKLDILANFQGGVEITPLQTCKGCDRSFYSEGEKEKHFEQSPVCLEWTRRNLIHTPLSTIPFFTFLEQGISTLLCSSASSCSFCHKPISHRKALEKHYQQSTICNRLAHDTFQKWYQKATTTSI